MTEFGNEISIKSAQIGELPLPIPVTVNPLIAFGISTIAFLPFYFVTVISVLFFMYSKHKQPQKEQTLLLKECSLGRFLKFAKAFSLPL